jgi:hypothetical protein
LMLLFVAIFDPNRKPIHCSRIFDPQYSCALENYGETACFREISGLLEYNRENIMKVCIPEIKQKNILNRRKHTIYMYDDSRFKSISHWDAMTRMLELCEKKSESIDIGIMHMTNKEEGVSTYSLKGFCVTSEESKKQ